jgi:hypothetical protein
VAAVSRAAAARVAAVVREMRAGHWVTLAVAAAVVTVRAIRKRRTHAN